VEIPELVLLLEETLVVGVEFVQGAVQAALGVSLPTGEPDSTEFGMGEVSAIIWPVRSAIRLWDFEMLEVLEEGRPLELFDT